MKPFARDVVASVVAYNNGREPERLARKFAAMRADPSTFYRGSAHLFFEDWARGSVPGSLAESPRGWICGDLHLENFGTFRGENGLVYFDVNDFDESALAPAALDVVRFIGSIHLATRHLGLANAGARALASDFLAAYARSLTIGKAFWLERATTEGAIRELLKSAKSRSRRALVAARTENGRGERLLLDGRRYLPVSDADRSMVEKSVGYWARSTTAPEFFEIIDVARRIAGTGALGLARYAVLVRGPRGGQPRLLDMKEAHTSAVEVSRLATRPPKKWPSEGHRLVAVQHLLQAVNPSLLVPVTCGGRSFVLRSLQPAEDKLSLDGLASRPKRLRTAIESMGHLTAWMHLRGAGRWRAAPVEAWQEWAGNPGWMRDALDTGERYAKQVGRDWAAFSAAYDGGRLGAAP